MTKGKEGESNFAKIMEEYGIECRDVSGDPAYWEKDIDFIISNGKRERTVEVKNDGRMYKTGNMYIETSNPRSKGGKGWFWFCQAELLAYADAVNRYMYVLDLDKLRGYIEENRYWLKEASTFDGSRGFLVKINDVEDCILWEIDY